MSRGKGQRRQEGTAGWYITALVTFMGPKGTQPVTQQVSSFVTGCLTGCMMYGETRSQRSTQEGGRKGSLIFSGPICYRVWLTKLWSPCSSGLLRSLPLLAAQDTSSHALECVLWSKSGIDDNPENQVCISLAWLPGSSWGERGGEDAFPAKQLVGSKWQKNLDQAELVVVVPKVEQVAQSLKRTEDGSEGIWWET